MLEGPEFAEELDGFRVERLATKALAMINPANSPLSPSKIPVARIRMLRDAVLSQDLGSCENCFEQLRDMGVSNAALVDHYIPATARLLGAEWVSDSLSFSNVSIGSARLQNALRLLDYGSAPAPSSHETYGSAIIATLPGAQHTLGASVLAQQLRRSGVDVTLILDASFEKLGNSIKQQKPSALLFSASRHESLEFLGKKVRYAKSASAQMPVLVGGNILERGNDVRNTIKEASTTDSWKEALDHLRLRPRA